MLGKKPFLLQTFFVSVDHLPVCVVLSIYIGDTVKQRFNANGSIFQWRNRMAWDLGNILVGGLLKLTIFPISRQNDEYGFLSIGKKRGINGSL